MLSERTFPGKTLAASLLLTLAGCGAPDGDGGGTIDTLDLDALRNLPYVGSVETSQHSGSGVVYHDAERSHPGLTLYTMQDLARAELIDETGNVVRAWRDPEAAVWERAELSRDGGVLVIGADAGPGPVYQDDRRYLARFDALGRLTWKKYIKAHHDVEALPDNRLLLLTLGRRRIPRVHTGTDLRDDLLTILDGNGTTLDQISLWDAFKNADASGRLHIPRPNQISGRAWIDVFHANSIETIPGRHPASRHPAFVEGNILVCIRHQDLVVVIDPARRRLVWSWGRGELAGPHDARLLDNGNILVFDNGLGRGYSRVIELDPVAERIVWEYRAKPAWSFFTLGKGSSQRLPNGNTLIAESDEGRAFEVTPGGAIVWDFLCPYETKPGHRAAIVRAIRHPRSIITSVEETP